MGDLQFDFSGRTVIITGAANGIGLSLAENFAATKGSVFLVDLDEKALHEAADRIGATGLAADVTKPGDVSAVVDAAIEATARVDILVNNAGILRDQVLWKLSDDDWTRVQETHLGGTFRLTRACVPHFRARGYGRVINVTSYTGLHGNVGQANYAAAKAGVIGLTKTSAKELARFGVTVNAISPNAETRMIASVPEEKRAELAAAIPMGRFAAPAEMFSTVAFLASEEAGYVTGVVLPVDGGLSM